MQGLLKIYGYIKRSRSMEKKMGHQANSVYTGDVGVYQDDQGKILLAISSLVCHGIKV